MLRICIFFVLLVAVFSADAQRLAGYGVEVNVMHGHMLKHTTAFTGPLPKNVRSVELNFIQQTAGQKPWQASRGYPLVGVSVSYVDYGIDSVYGIAIGIHPNIQIPVITSKNFEWTFRAGGGVGYVTRRYSRTDGPDADTLNPAIGSHMNNFSRFSTDLRYRVNTHLDVQAGVHFFHLSNASFRRPNLGINVWGLHIGMRYFPVTSQPKKIRTTIPPTPRWCGGIRAGVGFVETGPSDGPLYPAYLGSAWVGRRWRGRNRVFVGADASYSNRIEAFLKNNEIHVGEEAKHSWRGGVSVGNEFHFGRTGIVFQAGVYLKEAYLRAGRSYQKIGGQYYLLQRDRGDVRDAFIAILLNTHLSEAELAEFGVGIGF